MDQSNWSLGVEYIDIPPQYYTPDTGHGQRVRRYGYSSCSRIASVTEDDIDILVQNKDSETQKEFQKPLLQFFVAIYLKKESAPTLHLCHWKNYVN